LVESQPNVFPERLAGSNSQAASDHLDVDSQPVRARLRRLRSRIAGMGAASWVGLVLILGGAASVTVTFLIS